MTSIDWCSVSPDGSTIVIRGYRKLRFVSLDSGEEIETPLAGPSFGLSEAGGSIRWGSDSRSVWLLIGDTLQSGFSSGPLTCARRSKDGALWPAPPLRQPPGRLDQVSWVNGDGIGIAWFDLRGGYHRPELPDTNPSLAVLDARTGRLRNPIALRPALQEIWGEGGQEVYLDVVTSGMTRGGRVRALLRCSLWGAARGSSRTGGWAIWTEGEALRKFNHDLGDSWPTLRFTPDAEHLFVDYGLTASGIIAEHAPSPPPTPRTGRYAGLVDLSGRSLWMLTGTANAMNGRAQPAVSADGQRGLVRLPESCNSTRAWAIIALRNGRIIRRLRLSTPNSAGSTGFIGNSPWIASYQSLSIF